MPTPAPTPMTGPELLAHRIKIGLIRVTYRRNQVDPAADTAARARYRTAYALRKSRLQAQGLTTKGTPPRPAKPSQTSAERDASHRDSYVRRRDRFFAQGLNADGDPRRRDWDKPLVQSPSTVSTMST